MKDIYIVDLSKDKSKYNNYLSNKLIEKINQTLQDNKKVLIYINKRGSYNLRICKDCNYYFKCPKCDISLYVHNNPGVLLCHHCWFKTSLSLNCSKCNWTNLLDIWVWTKQIEDILLKIFPKNSIFRMDSDNIKTKLEKQQALTNFKNSSIIIWTKMITTWFDFSDIWLIWIVLVEGEFSVPQYDTDERIFTNFKQLIWRWWRKWTKTDIVLQTFIPNNTLIKNLVNLNFKDFLLSTLQDRKVFNYPPFIQLVYLKYKNKSKEKLKEYISFLKSKLDTINDWNYFISIAENIIKRDNCFYQNIIIKWNNVHTLLNLIKSDILKENNLVVIIKD